MADVYVSGVGITQFGKREESLLGLMAEAARQALESSSREAVEAVYVGCMNPEGFTGDGNIAAALTDYLGYGRVPALRVETATSAGAAAFFTACTAIAAGHYRSVLVVAGEKMAHLSTPRVSEILSLVIDPYERQYGVTMPALAALVSRAYMEEHSLTSHDVALVAVKNHRNATLNPQAHFQKEVTVEEVLESRMVADPLRLYDCSPISDGAAALLLTADRTAVRVAGIGHGGDHLTLRHRASLTSFRATQAAAARAFAMADCRPKDIQVVEVHDAFTPFELMNLEDVGFFPPGRAHRALEKGWTARGGRLPVNPSGGLKARGHPVGASGLAQIVEITLHLAGRAGARQVEARRGLAQSIGGIGVSNWVTILEAA